MGKKVGRLEAFEKQTFKREGFHRRVKAGPPEVVERLIKPPPGISSTFWKFFLARAS